jgi:hypothetical protein
LKICFIPLLPLPPFPCMLRLQMWTTTPGTIFTFLASGLESYIGQSSLRQDYKIICPFLFLWGWGGEFKTSSLHACKAGTLLLEPNLLSILLWLFWKWGSHELFTRAGLEPWSSQFHSQVVRIIGMSHQCLASIFNCFTFSVYIFNLSSIFWLLSFSSSTFLFWDDR